MIIRVLIFVISVGLISCRENQIQNKDVMSAEKAINYFAKDSIPEFISYQGKQQNKKDSVFYNFLRYFGSQDEIKMEDIEEITETEVFHFKNSSDIFRVYNIVLKKVPSNVWQEQYALVSDESRNKFCILDIKDPYVIDVGNSFFCIAGLKESDSKGVFRLYDFKDNKISKIFETPQIILNKSSECIIYQPFQLVETYDDINGDKKLDLIFKGNYLNFCEGLEEGPNYYDGDPIKVFGELKYVYTQRSIGNTTSFVLDSSLSKFISK